MGTPIRGLQARIPITDNQNYLYLSSFPLFPYQFTSFLYFSFNQIFIRRSKHPVNEKVTRVLTLAISNCPRAYFACREDVWAATRYFHPNKAKLLLATPAKGQQRSCNRFFRQPSPFPFREYSKSRQDGIIRSVSPIYDTRGDNFMHTVLRLSFSYYFRPFIEEQRYKVLASSFFLRKAIASWGEESNG